MADTPDTKPIEELDNDMMDEDEDEYTKSCTHGISLYDNCPDCGDH